MEHSVVGILKLTVPLDDHIVLSSDAYAVYIDSSPLPGLDVLRQLKLIIDFID